MGTNLPRPSGGIGAPPAPQTQAQIDAGTAAIMNARAGEDLALSVAAIVLASRGDDLGGMSAAVGIIHEFMPWVIERFARCDFATIGRNENRHDLMRVLAGTTAESKRAMNSFASEFLAQGILERLGMRHVPVRIVTAKDARELGAGFAVKAIAPKDGRLHFAAGTELLEDDTAVLVSEVLRDAASFDYFRRKVLKQSEDSFGTGVFAKLYVKSSFVEVDRTIKEMLVRACGKSAESADDLFAGFQPTPTEIATIERKARWDGEQFLRICAARTFIG